MARSGRRPGGQDTQADILTAARAAFGEHGYHAATIRSIAGRAKVDPALVHHYFGTKEELFAAAVRLPVTPAAFEEAIMGPGLVGAGERLAAAFFHVWEGPETRDALLTIMRGALATEQGAVVLRDFFGSVLVGRLGRHLPGDDAELRMGLAAAHLIGLALLRYVVKFPDLASASIDDLVARVGPRLQTYLDGP